MMRPPNLQDRVLQLPLFLLMFGAASLSMLVPAIHGGVTAAFLEVTAVMTLSRQYLWEKLENGELDLDRLEKGEVPPLAR